MTEDSKVAVSPKFVISENSSEVFCVRFSSDGQLVAAGCADGAIKVYSTHSGRLCYNLNVGVINSFPTTALRWRPHSLNSKTRNVLLSANADGTVKHWHISSGKCLHTIEEEGNQIFCTDYTADGSKFVTAGKDQKVRLYDEATKSLISTMKGEYGMQNPGHSNRVFSLKYNPANENIVISGGWDNTIQVWDLRVNQSVKSIYGPHICGDAVDIWDTTILSGSYRPEDPLQLWDISSGELIQNVPWRNDGEVNVKPPMLYGAQFSKNRAQLIAAGGAGSNEAKVFERSTGKTIATVSGMNRAVYTVDFSADSKMLAIAGGDTSIRVLDITEAN